MFRAAPAVRLVLFGVVVLAAAAAGAMAVQPAAPELTFDQPLAHYGAETPKIRKLPDGGRIAVGSRTGHDITVQWRDPQGTSWSAPHQVQRQPKLWTHDMSVDQADGTVTIAPDFWSQRILDDDYAPKITTLTVCRNYWCDASRTSDRLTSAAIADAGALVVFQTDDKHLLLWEDGRGYRTSTVTGMPKGDQRIRVMPDGSLVGVAGRWDGKQCHYVLYTAGRRSTSFEEKVESPGFYDAKPCYLASADVAGKNTVNVWIESLSDDITFHRDGSTWSVDKRLLSRMQIRDTRGRSTIAPTEVRVGRGKTAVVGSRDQRSILLQVRPGPSKRWGKQSVVARAPAGTVCRNVSTAEGAGKKPLTMILVHCYRDGRRVKTVDAPSDIAVVLATTNGRHWAIGSIEDPRWDALYSRPALMAVGTESGLLYRGGRTFATVRLSSDRQWDGLALTLDGTRLVRIPGNGDAAGQCVPRWTVAPVTATSWPAATPFAAEGFPRPGSCTGSITPETDTIFMTGVYQAEWSWEGGMRLRNGRLAVMPPIE
jgi:hypothetical protein